MKSRMFLQKAGRFFLALVCALSLLGSVAAAPAASRKSGAEVISPLLYVEKVQRSNVLPQADGTFARVKKLQKVPVGEIEPENIHTYGMCVDYIVEGDRK